MTVSRPHVGSKPRWSVVVPYYNESAGFLESTLRSLAAQVERPLTLILVDNASTDGSAAIARSVTDNIASVTTLHLLERTPGQVHALETGLAAVETEFVAICDADTVYPPHYLSHAAELFDQHGQRVVAVLAMGVGADPNRWSARIKRRKGVILSRVLRGQAHTGGYGHCFRTEALKASGGYSERLWPYLLKDHELIHRLQKKGQTLYHADQWCQSSDRRFDRSALRWTLFERILYHLTPSAAKDWFFYTFLAARFARRGMRDLKLRDRTWDADNLPSATAAPPGGNF
jgi:glycosyltransferase involved in cell wall biosynthesis